MALGGHDMFMAEVLQVARISSATLYRWMKQHPADVMPDPNSQRGHPFPRPVRKTGKQVIWDADKVRTWLKDNIEILAQPREKPTITLTWERLLAGLRSGQTKAAEEALGAHQSAADLAGIVSIENLGTDARVRFRSINEAVTFNLTY
jgi:predicted DNA-binding transcriptional regulator AlpA